MSGATIDHMVAFTLFLAALLIFFGFFNQLNQTAIVYEQHNEIATECTNILDSILLNPGSPDDWGVMSNSAHNLVYLGLQDPEFDQYTLNPFSLMRLLSSSQEVYENQTEEWYSNELWDQNGGYLLLQDTQCISYHNVTSLLGINGTYDFQLMITPTLTVNITQVPADDLKLEIQVYGSGFPLPDANLNYLMFWTNTSANGYPILNQYNSTSDLLLPTDSSGVTSKDFPSLNNETAFTCIVEASEGGLLGIGYLSQQTMPNIGNLIPFIENFDNGTANVLLAQTTGTGELYFNATFYMLPDNFVPIATGSFNGTVTPGSYQNLTITTNNSTGFLVAAYGTGAYGIVVMPLGIGSIGGSVVFGGNPFGKQWVASDIRQVLIGDIAYQAKLSLWSLQGYGVSG